MRDIRPDRYEDRYEDVVRSMISREDELFHHRMSWLAAFNGLLFAALSFSWDKRGARPLAIMFCILGFIISFLHASGILGGGRAQRRLLLWWYQNSKLNYCGPGVMGLEPPFKKTWMLWFTPWFLSALLFAIAWLSIFSYILWPEWFLNKFSFLNKPTAVYKIFV